MKQKIDCLYILLKDASEHPPLYFSLAPIKLAYGIYCSTVGKEEQSLRVRMIEQAKLEALRSLK